MNTTLLKGWRKLKLWRRGCPPPSNFYSSHIGAPSPICLERTPCVCGFHAHIVSPDRRLVDGSVDGCWNERGVHCLKKLPS